MFNLSLRCFVLNSHKCSTSILSGIVHVLKAVAIVISEHINLLTIVVVSHFLSAKVSGEWRFNPDFVT